MKLLVTGGAGFIGSNFIHYWLKKYPKDKITNLDKLTYAGNPANVADLESNPRYKFVKGDVCDAKVLDKIVPKVETIVHFAAETHNDRSVENPFPFVQTNIVGTLTLLEAARKHGNKRIHLISTDEVFGRLPLDRPDLKFSENTCYAPQIPYAASKASADHFVRAYGETHKVPITISNCSNNYGPYQGPEKLIPLTITRALNDEEIPVYGEGNQVRDWIHVFDHCRGIDLLLHKGKVGETYLFGGDGERTNIWIIKKILNILKKPESLIVHVGDRKGHDPRYAINYSKSKKELGFTPSKSVDAWLQDTVDWYRKNTKIWNPLKKEADKIAEKYLAKRI